MFRIISTKRYKRLLTERRFLIDLTSGIISDVTGNIENESSTLKDSVVINIEDYKK